MITPKHLGDLIVVLIEVERRNLSFKLFHMYLLGHEKRYLSSLSGGKDSIANTVLAKIHGERIDACLISEAMFDKRNGISAENPQHMAFIREKVIPLFESWDIPVIILHGEYDYLDVFNHIITKPRSCPEHKGMRRGFPMAGTCAFKRDCKLKPIEDYLRNLHKEGVEVFQYLGIAADEPVRLKSMHKNDHMISLLENYNYTEAQAFELCKEYGLLSPLYLNGGTRQGCWCCPLAKDHEVISIMQQYPEAWERFVSLEDTPNKIYNRWNVYSTESLHERSERLKKAV